MSKVYEIGICKKKGEKILKINKIKAIKAKGIRGDRKYKEANHKLSQITLIEIENINYFNKLIENPIPPLFFRRNIVTKGINLNYLVGNEFYVGDVKLKAHYLCRPCRYLQTLLMQDNFVNELQTRGGIRCEILSTGFIYKNDKII